MDLFRTLLFVVGLLFTKKFLGHLLTQWAANQMTVIGLLDAAGNPRKAGKMKGTAVIAGAGISGLVAARILSDHFEDVLVVEPDPIEMRGPEATMEKNRPRVMQWHGQHGFLGIMLAICRSLFENFDEKAIKSGMHIGDSNQFRSSLFGRETLPVSRGAPDVLVSWRPGLEIFLRDLVVSGCPNVKFLRGIVTSLVSSEDGKSIEAVHIRPHVPEASGPSKDELTVPCTLFADCSGVSAIGVKLLPRASPHWKGPARKDEYSAKATYTACVLEVPSKVAEKLTFGNGIKWDDMGWVTTFVPEPGLHTRGYAMSKLAPTLFQLGALQWGDQYELPYSLQDYLEFATDVETNMSRQGPRQDILDGIRTLAEGMEEAGKEAHFFPLKDTRQYFLRYDLTPASALPSNFVVLGDAIIKLNPVFGQGCSKAMIDAVSLDGALRELKASNGIPDGFSTKVLKMQKQRSASMFDLTRTLDYGYPTTTPMEGETLEVGAAQRAYIAAFMRLGHYDEKSSLTIARVLQMLAPPTEMFSPRVVALIVWHWLRGSVSKPCVQDVSTQ